MKSIKNSVEIKGFHSSHDRDAAALCQYFCWLERAVDKEEVDGNLLQFDNNFLQQYLYNR